MNAAIILDLLMYGIMRLSQNSPPTRVLRMRLMPTQAQDVPNALALEGGFLRQVLIK